MARELVRPPKVYGVSPTGPPDGGMDDAEIYQTLGKAGGFDAAADAWMDAAREEWYRLQPPEGSTTEKAAKRQ